MHSPTKQYLGDSVYVELERGMLKLTTENGLGPNNTIYLEPEVYTALTRYVDRTALSLRSDGGADWVMQKPLLLPLDAADEIGTDGPRLPGG
jgi:hypothetical protein